MEHPPPGMTLQTPDACAPLCTSHLESAQAGSGALADLACPLFSGTTALPCLVSGGRMSASYVDAFTSCLWREGRPILITHPPSPPMATADGLRQICSWLGG